jgi:hypothetical protein
MTWSGTISNTTLIIPLKKNVVDRHGDTAVETRIPIAFSEAERKQSMQRRCVCPRCETAGSFHVEGVSETGVTAGRKGRSPAIHPFPSSVHESLSDVHVVLNDTDVNVLVLQ